MNFEVLVGVDIQMFGVEMNKKGPLFVNLQCISLMELGWWEWPRGIKEDFNSSQGNFFQSM